MAENPDLFGDSSDSECELKVNKSYANRYDDWRRNEEMQKLKAQNITSSSSESESEDDLPDDGDEKEFFMTLSLVMGKDPKIYDDSVNFFKESNENDIKSEKKKKSKPMFMKDYERKLLLETNGQLSDDDESFPAKEPTYIEEQEELKRKFKAAFEDLDNNEEEGNLLQVRKKSEEEEKMEEEDYIQWLKGQKNEIGDDTAKDMSFLHKYWTDPDIDSDEKFLKDYILNKRYRETDKSEEIPTYDEITRDVNELSDDEKDLQAQELFEHKYNFRFEEPDAEFIKRYPRVIEDSLRRKDNRRKIMRDEHRERKKRERQQKKEELKRLKAMFREEKLAKWKEVAGADELNLDEKFIDGDFDPEKHDQKMKEMFSDNFYAVAEDEKPQFAYDEEIDDEEDWDNWVRVNNISIDANQNNDDIPKMPYLTVENDDDKDEAKDSKQDFQKEMIESTQKKKKERKKSLFAQTVAKPKPVYDASGKSFEDYLEEYYKMDYEDIIGDMPVRFKYRKVIPNSYGLSIDEMLAAEDAELNRWSSVKKTYQYKNEQEELCEVHAYEQKASNFYKKKLILASLYMDNGENKDEKNVVSKKERNKHKSSFKSTSNANECEGLQNRSKRQKSNAALINDDPNVSGNPENKTDASKQKRKQNQSNIKSQLLENPENYYSSLESEANSVDTKTEQNDVLKNKKRKKQKSSFENASNENEHEEFKNPGKSNESLIKDEQNDSRNLENNTGASKKKRKRKRSKNKSHVLEQPENIQSSLDSEVNNVNTKSKRRRKRSRGSVKSNGAQNKTFHLVNNTNIKHYVNDDKKLAMSDQRLKAYGINPKKFKNKIIYSKP